MSQYNQFASAINKIYEDLQKMKDGWNNQDNHNYIDSIEEYKQMVSNVSELIKNNDSGPTKINDDMEALGND